MVQFARKIQGVKGKAGPGLSTPARGCILSPMKNTLYYGDNLDVLRLHVQDESIDLVYLDPPFNSDQNYNVLFKEQDGARAASQIHAFEDTWQWDQGAAAAYQEMVESGGQVSLAMQAFHTVLGPSNMLAYLSMMAPRLKELCRVLKPTGSIYLHCDPTASHYLKVLMDAVFGPGNFRNEIVWKRRYGTFSTVHRSTKFGACTDTILFYARSQEAKFHPQYSFADSSYREYVDRTFRHTDEHGRKFRIADLANPALRPNLIYEYKGYKPPPTDGQYRAKRWSNGTGRAACTFQKIRTGGFSESDFWTN